MEVPRAGAEVPLYAGLTNSFRAITTSFLGVSIYTYPTPLGEDADL